MRAYKIIFRLDYPTTFGMLDILGDTAGFLEKETREAPFANATINVNPVEHLITCTAHLPSPDAADDGFRLMHNVKTLSAVIEHQKGLELSELHEHPAIILTDKLIEHLDFADVSRFERLGIRVWILETLRFKAIRDSMVSKLDTLNSALMKSFASAEDVGVVFESVNKEGSSVRVIMGPYQKTETAKYFGLENSVQEGLILDIDMWQTKVEIPKFRLSRQAAYFEAAFQKLAGDLVSSLTEEPR